MKVLYGVQGTGNGHISRAREVSKYLRNANVDVQFLFSGREPDKYFDMETFGDYVCYPGLTFQTKNGRISYIRTALGNNLFRFVRDIQRLKLDEVDVVISDFEPISAWAGRRARKTVIGLGHQYAFGHQIPKAGDHILASTIMRYFAPVDVSLGLHWHHFGHAILPPIIDTSLARTQQPDPIKIVVYLPFEDQARVTCLLRQLPAFQFVQYAPSLSDGQEDNVQLRTTSHDAFKQDLRTTRGVICNSGFELISECLQLGVPVLTKPLAGQMEQLSNAVALNQLGYATILKSLEREPISRWLDSNPAPPTLKFANVAESVTNWLLGGMTDTPQQLSERLWA